jgi:hypothetical protein
VGRRELSAARPAVPVQDAEIEAVAHVVQA